MSQLIACKTKNGVIFGADGKAVDVDSSGNLIELKVERLHQLSDHAVILNAGAASGEEMCRALKHFVGEERLHRIDDIYQAALPFLATEYERFMRRTCEVHPIDPIHQVTFILGGYTDKDPQSPYHLYLIWTKRKLPLLDSDEIASAFSVPRLIKVEHRLHQLVAKNADLDAVMGEVRQALEKQAARDEEVSEPLSFACVTPGGFTRI